MDDEIKVEKKKPTGYIITIVVLAVLLVALFITFTVETNKHVKQRMNASISYTLLETSYENLKEENEILKEKTSTDWIEFVSYKTAFEYSFVMATLGLDTAAEYLSTAIAETVEEYDMSLYEQQQYAEKCNSIVAEFGDKVEEIYG